MNNKVINSSDMFKGQKDQDKWVIQTVFPDKKEGFFLDIAAADGVTHSNTHVLEKQFGWKGICIEPNPDFFLNLKKIRNCITDNSVISDGHEKVRFRIDNGQLGGIVAEDTDNSERIRGGQLKTAVIISLKTKMLIEILDDYNAPPIIDYFSLDIEGAEERVISSFDFTKYQFNSITIERPTPLVNEALFDNGYVFVKNFSFDSFYVHSSVLFENHIECQPFEQIPPKAW